MCGRFALTETDRVLVAADLASRSSLSSRTGRATISRGCKVILSSCRPSLQKLCARSRNFPKRRILADLDPSLCCKRHLKALVCQFRHRYREFEFNALLPSSPYLSRDVARITEKPATTASFANVRSRRTPLSGLTIRN